MDFQKISVTTFASVYFHRIALAKALSLPFAILFVANVVSLLLPNLALEVGAGILGLMAHTLYAVTTHRIVLLGSDSLPEWGLLKWTKRETLFVVHAIVLLLLSVVPISIFLIPTVGPVLGFLATAAMYWVLGRLSLVFPAIAIERGVSFDWSWEHTKNYQLLMMAVVIVFPIVLSLPIFIIGLLPYTSFFTNLLTIFITVFTVAALSVTYRSISEEIDKHV